MIWRTVDDETGHPAKRQNILGEIPARLISKRDWRRSFYEVYAQQPGHAEGGRNKDRTWNIFLRSNNCVWIEIVAVLPVQLSQFCIVIRRDCGFAGSLIPAQEGCHHNKNSSSRTSRRCYDLGVCVGVGWAG